MLSTAFLLLLYVFVLVVAILAWSAQRTAEKARELRDADRRYFEALVGAMKDTIDKSAGAKLRAELEDVRSALQVHEQSNRREFGKLWGHRNGRAPVTVDAETGEVSEDDDIAAMLRLQKAGPGGP